jgi:hypothetical protein
LKIGFLGWLALMGGSVSLLRAAGKGRRGWEVACLILLACLPPLWLCIEGGFHPEDLLAMGLAIAALSLALRDRWLIAGIMIAFAILSQQFALLVAVPLLFVAPAGRRVVYAASTGAVLAIATTVLYALSSSSAVHAVFLGTGNTGGIGGAVVSELGLHGTTELLISRILPLVLAALIAVLAVRRLGSVCLQPVVLLSLIAVSLALRLVFEQQLFGYYFMALSVALLLLDVSRGHIRASVLAWFALASLVALIGLGSTALDLLRAVPPGTAMVILPVSVIVLALFLILRTLLRGFDVIAIGIWVSYLIAALLVWNTTDVFGQPPIWFWQLALVPSGIALAASPLVARLLGGERLWQARPQTPSM